MRTLLLTLVGWLLIGSLPAPAQEAKIGSTLPLADRPMTNVDGKKLTLKELFGEKGLVISFWSNTCPWVARYEDRFLALAREYQKKGFGFAVINANDPSAYPKESLEEMKKRAEAKKYPFPYLVDEGSALARALGATRTPHIYVYNAEGKLVYVGAIDDSPADPSKVEKQYLRDALEALLAGKEPPVKQTKAFGCTIKPYPSE